MKNIFVRLYNYLEKKQWIFFILFATLFLLAGYFATQVKFEEDISKILPKDKKIEKLNEVFQNSKFADRLVVTISLKDTTAVSQPDSLVAFADSFANAVQNHLQPYIKKINYKVEEDLVMDLFNTVNDHLPVYLTEKDYRSIDSLVSTQTVRSTLEQNFRTLTSPSGIALKSMISNDPVGISFIALKKLQQLQYDENFELYDSYVVTKDHQHLMVFISPAYSPNNTGKNAVLLDGIDKIIDSLQATDFKNVEARYFGATAVSVGNALQLRKDSLITQGLTIIFIIVFLGVYFRKKRAPFIILIPVVFGALFALAAIYFIKGSISVIALGSGSVVLGIAVNYSLHVFNHYRHVRSIREVIRDLSFPLTVGSITTIGGFFCLEFVESEMLKDLGLFAAFSLIGASLCSLIFLPHFVASKKELTADAPIANSWIDKIASLRPEYNKYLVIGIILLTFVFGYTARNVGFENDLNRMNFMSDKLKQAETELNKINAYALQSVYLVTEGSTLNEALRNNERLDQEIETLKSKNIISKSSGVSSLIISDSLQAERISRWKQYWTAEKKELLISTLKKDGADLKFSASAFDNFTSLLNKNFQPLDSTESASTRKSFLDDYITEKPGQASVVTLVKVAPENKQTIYKTFENDSNIVVVDKQYLTARLVAIVNTDFTSIALMTSILVFVVLLIMYGRIELTLISFIPMFISWVWILGIMGIAGIKFNIINIIISALIFGLGDDYSLFIMDGLLQEYKTGRKNLSSYKSSIFLSAITTIAGLGVLIFAQHPALRSIALISIIGIVCVVIMSQILIPFLFALLIKNRADKKFFPWTFAGLAKSIFSFSYFVFGSILLTIIGFIFAKLNPFNKEKGKLIYHKILSKYSWSLIYIMRNFKKEIINTQKEDFSKPAVVIVNHQSFLDILCTILLNPKLILFTNNWVWNSPVFGTVVKLADYFPVEEGAEKSIDLIADRVKQGYSVLIFPEGTRSEDGSIKRFHKGAFYLAEKLQLDILPVLMHGSGYTMTKGDFLLKDGRITTKFLPRIKPGDIQFGNGYAERTKGISRYFRNEFHQLKTEVEQTSFFKEQLKYNYLYKGPALEWYMRIKVRLEKNYQFFHEQLPKQGKILDIGCGYGFMSYMLYFTSSRRNITGVDYDEEKIQTANHCFSKTDDINFVAADVLQYPFENYDGIILADMLHYLQPDQQRVIIIKCMQHLNPGGVMIIRDGNKDLEERHKGTKLTEFFSTKVFGFNKTSGHQLSFLSAGMIREIATEQQMQWKEIDKSKFTSNIVFVIKNEPAAQ